jgi:hypothetical protein
MPFWHLHGTIFFLSPSQDQPAVSDLCPPGLINLLVYVLKSYL